MPLDGFSDRIGCDEHLHTQCKIDAGEPVSKDQSQGSLNTC